MIRFPCHCGYTFELDEDKAGGLAQCPRCGRLNDVPTLSDLAAISEDGTYKMDAGPGPVEPDRLEQLNLAFARRRVDDYGREIDLRPTMEDILRAGDAGDADNGLGPIDLAAPPPARPSAPKYDPVTGELIRPLDLGPGYAAPPKPAPMRQRTLKYAAPETVDNLREARLFLELFSLPNAMVMVIVFIIHIFVQFMALSAMVGMLLVVPFSFIILGALVAHYANTIDETGTEARDELPRPGRGLSWHDDLWGAFVRWTFALIVSYAPLLVLAMWAPLPDVARAGIAAGAVLFGTLVFPAVVLTTTTSGTVLNLRPDRVIGVVGRIGILKYPVAVILWALAAATYGYGFVAINLTVARLVSGDGPWFTHAAVTYPALLAGIYLMHAFCWFMGIQYRRHHVDFPWVLQRFVGGSQAAQGKRHGFTVLPQVDPAKVQPRRARVAATQPVVSGPPVAPRPVQPIDPDQGPHA